MKISRAPFALRVVRRREGLAGIVYQRSADNRGRNRLRRVASLGPLAFVAGTPLLREAVRAAGDRRRKLAPGPYYALDADWGPRVAAFALVSSGLRDGERLGRAADHLRHADAAEAAWWLGLMTGPGGDRAVRALRILTEAVR